MNVDPYSLPENQKSPRFWVEIVTLSTLFFGGVILAIHLISSDGIFSPDSPFSSAYKKVETHQKMIEKTIAQDLDGENKLNFGKEVNSVKDGKLAD